MSANCPICLEDLNRPTVCENTKGGVVSTILIALKDDVDHWPSKQAPALRQGLADHIETVAGDNMTMKPGKRFFKIEIKKNSAELKYTLQGESGSRSLKASLQMYTPALRSNVLGFMAATANQEMVLLCQTANKDWHMLGDGDEGCEFESGEATSGKAGTDAHGADLTFYTDTAAPTIYKGDIDSLLEVNGSAPTIAISTPESVSGTGVTLKATATASSITAGGFRYRKEGTSTWHNEAVSSIASGTEFSASLSGLTASTDYMYYAYVVVDGREIRTETYAFTTES